MLQEKYERINKFITHTNWQSSYTYNGRYGDIGVTDRVVEYINKTGKSNLKIIDVGCSVGIASKQMKDELNVLYKSLNIEITGLDVKSEIRENAELYLNKFIVGDIMDVDIIEKFDIVICTRMMLYGHPLRKAVMFRQCVELMKYDGCMITDGCYTSSSKKVVLITGKNNVVEYSNKIESNWKKMNVFSKSLMNFCIFLSKLMSYANTKPSYKRPSWFFRDA